MARFIHLPTRFLPKKQGRRRLRARSGSPAALRSPSRLAFASQERRGASLMEYIFFSGAIVNSAGRGSSAALMEAEMDAAFHHRDLWVLISVGNSAYVISSSSSARALAFVGSVVRGNDSRSARRFVLEGHFVALSALGDRFAIGWPRHSACLGFSSAPALPGPYLLPLVRAGCSSGCRCCFYLDQ